MPFVRQPLVKTPIMSLLCPSAHRLSTVARMRATELPEATLYRRGGAIEYLSAATKSDAACARFRRGYAQLTAGPSCRSSTWRGGFRFSGAGGHRIPERVSPKTMLQVTRNSLRLRAWKSIAYV